MRKGTFSVKKAGANSAAHNSRENAPKYLLGLDPLTQNYYELIQSDKDFILEAQQIYKDKIGQSMQKKQIPNLVQETVLTLQKNQNENDVKRVFEKLHQKFGGHTLLELSVHRDEGHFAKDDIAYYPTKNILKKENDWYIQSDPNSKEFDIKVNINEFEKVHNYHAHAKFSMFDKELGKSARMQKKDMSERIKFVSQELGLEFNPDKKTSHIQKPVHQVKDEHHAKAKALQEQQYNFRDMQKRITELQELTAEQKKELHKLNSETKNTPELEAKNIKIQQLEREIQELKTERKAYVKAFKEILPNSRNEVEVVEYAKTLKNELQATKSLKAENDTLKQEKIVLKQDMSVLRAINDELTLTIGKKDKQLQSNTEKMKVVEKALEPYGFESKDSGRSWFQRLNDFIGQLQKKIIALKKENQELKALVPKSVTQSNLQKVQEMKSKSTLDDLYQQGVAIEKENKNRGLER